MPSGPYRRPGYWKYGPGDPRWSRVRKGPPSAALASPPIVLTIGVNGIGINSGTGQAFANVIGSINPNTSVNTPFGPVNPILNPSFEYDVAGNTPVAWSTTANNNFISSGATATVVNTTSAVGAQSVQVTSASGTRGIAIPVTGQFVVGNTYAISGFARGAVGGETMTIWAGVNGVDQANSAHVLTTSWAQYTTFWTPTRPETSIFVAFVNSTGSAETFYVDAVNLQNSPTAPAYFDGDTTGCVWLGTPGNSSSQQEGARWWMVYGTQLPLGLGSSTTPVTLINIGTTPQTVIFELTGLTAGATYYVAMVGATNAGTVYGITVPFVAAVPPAPVSQPVVPIGVPSVTIPHFNLPFTMINSASGNLPVGIEVVEQDTTEEILACVTTIVDCPIGACPQLPNFGIPEPTFSQAPLNPSGVISAIEILEPRAHESAISQIMPDGVSWGMTLTTTPPTSNQS